MLRAFLLVIVAATLVFSAGCRTSDTGSREFIPGKGWVPVR